jgi:hypothetical protein
MSGLDPMRTWRNLRTRARTEPAFLAARRTARHAIPGCKQFLAPRITTRLIRVRVSTHQPAGRSGSETQKATADGVASLMNEYLASEMLIFGSKRCALGQRAGSVSGPTPTVPEAGRGSMQLTDPCVC